MAHFCLFYSSVYLFDMFLRLKWRTSICGLNTVVRSNVPTFQRLRTQMFVCFLNLQRCMRLSTILVCGYLNYHHFGFWLLLN